MPLYDYRCTQCGQTVEIRHGFNEAHADPCTACGGALNRVFNPAPIVFKGSGFYVTDSRPASSSSDAAAPASKTDASSAPKSSGSGESAA